MLTIRHRNLVFIAEPLANLRKSLTVINVKGDDAERDL